MSLAQRFERRLEGVVGSAFARVFKGQVEPVEIGSALQREAGDKRAVMGSGKVLAPNRYRVSLSASDHERLVPWEAQLCNSLAELVQEHLDENHWATVGDIEVVLHLEPTLHTGVFGVASRMEPAAPPRRRPYDSLSLPMMAGQAPGQYASPFGSIPVDPQQPHAREHPDRPQQAEPAVNYSNLQYPEPEYPSPEYANPAYPVSAYPVSARPIPEYYDPYDPPGRRPDPVGPDRGGTGPAQGEPLRRTQVSAVITLDGSDSRLALRPGSNVIGRGHDSDLQLVDQGVSRKHVDVQFDGRYAVAYDLGSTNGTSVNGHSIGSHQLQHGDVLRIGHSRLVFHEDRE